MSENNHKSRPNHFNIFTVKVPCPSCGAPVEFVSVGSVMSVCSYCQTTVIREGDEIKSQGKQSLVIEDYSPLQLGSSGNYDNRTFVLVGRIQLEYDEGIWNEWYLQFDDGNTGWLSESLGQYSLTFDKGEQPNLPSYHQLQIGNTVLFTNTDYSITDKRSATAIAGEGELPFIMGKGWQTWGIDARYKRQFITLDYAENGVEGAPIIYQGSAVTLDNLNMQLLKDDRQLNDNGKVNNNNQTIAKLDCPNCGSPVPYIAGATNCLLCPACHSEIELTEKTAQLVQLHSMMQKQKTSLQLGDKARINAAELISVSEWDTSLETNTDTNNRSYDYVVIGIMRLQEGETNEVWIEYLLYSFTDGFLWLEETNDGWRIARVLNELPTGNGKQWISYKNKKWYRKYDEDYLSQVVYAIGAFNWQVKINDVMTVRDFSKGQQIICQEKNKNEMTYTISSPITLDTINAWFGKELEITDTLSSEGSVSTKNFLGWGVIFISLLFIIFICVYAYIDEAKRKAQWAKERQEARSQTTTTTATDSEKQEDIGAWYDYYPSTLGGRTGYSSSGSHK